MIVDLVGNCGVCYNLVLFEWDVCSDLNSGPMSFAGLVSLSLLCQNHGSQ